MPMTTEPTATIRGSSIGPLNSRFSAPRPAKVAGRYAKAAMAHSTAEMTAER